MIVRRAELSDIPAVAALERAEFPGGADEGMLARLWETDGGVILAAEEGNDLLGYVWARFVRGFIQKGADLVVSHDMPVAIRT